MGATAGCLAQTEFPLTERHQGGRKGPFGQPERHQGRHEAPGRHQRGRKEPFGQLARRQKGRKGSIGQSAGQPGRHQGGTRETCSAGLPIEFRFWKGAGFCLTFNTISMANGPVRGTSWGGLHGRLPSTDWKGLFGQPERHQEGRTACEAPGRQERTKNQLDSLLSAKLLEP